MSNSQSYWYIYTEIGLERKVRPYYNRRSAFIEGAGWISSSLINSGIPIALTSVNLPEHNYRCSYM
nr:ALI_HP1_G0023510.mRNA.1.CDS.1 [Saccharomyces cerevisiae]